MDWRAGQDQRTGDGEDRGMYSINGRRLKGDRELKRRQEQPVRFALISKLERLQESLKDSLKEQVNAFKKKILKIT